MPAASDDALRAARELHCLVGRLRRRMREFHSPEDVASGVLPVPLRIDKAGPATATVLAA